MRRSNNFRTGPRKSRAPLFLLLLLLGLVALIFWLQGRATEVPARPIEVDVTNAALAK